MRRTAESLAKSICELQRKINKLVWEGEIKEAQELQKQQYALKEDLKFYKYKPKIKQAKILLKLY